MDFSLTNTSLWYMIVQTGLVSLLLLFGNLLRRKIRPLRRSLLPTAVIAGFLELALRNLDWVPLERLFLDGVTYHMTAIGFIALSLRMPSRHDPAMQHLNRRDGVRSGMLIVSSYLIQGFIGLLVMIVLAGLFIPDLFRAAGLLLPLGFGQGPGQANNIGSTYQRVYGFTGGTAFGLAIATTGFLWASIGGIIYLNYLVRKKKVAARIDQDLTAGTEPIHEPVADSDEIPLTEAVDKSTIQIALVLLVYFFVFLFSAGITLLVKNVPQLSGLENTIVPLIWGFNFLIGSSFALLLRWALSLMRRQGIMKRQYTNNYLLNRISGTAFDIMIITSIISIEIDDLSGLWVPYLVLTTVGGLVTFLYVKFAAKRLFPSYQMEGMLSMYGMMTGTVSTGILLLREVDPGFRTPAANNLVIGSSVAIALGFPLLLMVGLAPQSTLLLYITLAAIAVYFTVLNWLLFRRKADQDVRKQTPPKA